jgi:hypothetical protein
LRDEVERILREFFGNKPIPDRVAEAIARGCPLITRGED